MEIEEVAEKVRAKYHEKGDELLTHMIGSGECGVCVGERRALEWVLSLLDGNEIDC